MKRTTELAILSLFSILVLYFIPPFWETNDDIVMSMIAHGFGSSAESASTLLFSNAAWGHFVKLILNFCSNSYSLCMYMVLISSTYALFHAANLLGFGIFCTLPLLTILMTRPLVIPQFTITAGMAAVCAVLYLHLYSRDRMSRQVYLKFAVLFFLVSVLIRFTETVAVLLVASTTLPWTKLWTDKFFRKCCLIASITGILVASLDYSAYSGPEWQQYKAFQTVRPQFTDFQVGIRLKENPDLLSKYNYSENDVDLLSMFFTADPKISDPIKLTNMLAELPPFFSVKTTIENIKTAVLFLGNEYLYVLMLAGAFTFLLSNKRKTWSTWILFLFVIVGFGLIGRPAIGRVYYPLVALVALTPIWTSEFSRAKKTLLAAVLMTLSIVNIKLLYSTSKTKQALAEAARRDIAKIPKETIVSWGGTFPYELFYRPFNIDTGTYRHRIFALDSTTWAPTSIAAVESRYNNDFRSQLNSEKGILILMDEHAFNHFETYCKEHHSGQLTVLLKQVFAHNPSSALYRIRCIKDI